MSINAKLKKLYSAQINGLEEISNKSDVITEKETYSNWDGPHLMYCWEQDYYDAPLKILFIGQENNAFFDCAWGEIEKPLEKYIEFALAEKKKNVTLFWQAIYEIKVLLNPISENSKNFLWTNVSKYSTWEGKRINEDDFHFISERFNVLEEEIKILNPNIIIFFSGPDYDEWVKDQLTFKIEFNKRILSTIPCRELSLVKSGDEEQILPMRSYRTYHPNYLRRSDKWYFLNAIALDCMGFNLETIIEKLKSDFKTLKDVRVDEGEIGKNFGCNKSTLKLEVTKWRNFSIGFQFEENAFCSFFYGILNDKEIEDEKLIIELNLLMGNDEKPTKLWPYWNWYEQKNWDKKTFEEIKTGEFIKKIQSLIDELIEKTNRFKM